MSCQQVDKYAYLYCNNELPPDLLSKMDLHLKNCKHCQTKIYLTKIENQVLQEGYGIPDLPDDFTSKVLKSVQTLDRPESSPVQINNAPISKRKTKSYLVASTALAATLLMALFIPGIMDLPGFGFNNKQQVVQNDHQASLENVEADFNKVLEESKLEPKLKGVTPAGVAEEKPATIASVTQDLPEIFGGDGGVLRTGAPAPQMFSATTQRDVRDIRVDQIIPEFNFDQDMVYVQPDNVPTSYQLTDILSNVDNELSFVYVNSSSGDTLTISLLPIENTSINSTKEMSPLVTPLTVDNNLKQSLYNSLNLKYIYKDCLFSVTITGNLSPQELTNLANSLKYKEAECDDNH